MQKTVYAMLTALLLTGNVCFAQSAFTITGMVKDKDGATIPSATVALLKEDGTVLKTTTADEKGAYAFKDIETGKYNVQVQAAGYTNTGETIAVLGNTETNLIAAKASKTLNEVTISSKKPAIETGLGKTIMNIDPATTSAGATVIDLLRKTPGVRVENNNISLHNNGVLVLVDDKQTYMSGQELSDYFASIGADQVEQLELIDQPSSKYDAEGSGGIINIKMRRQRKRGTNGNVSLAAGQGMYTNTHNSANITYRKDKLTLNANAGYMHATGFAFKDVYRDVTDPVSGDIANRSEMHSFQKEIFEDYNLKTGVDYAATKKLTVGGSAKGVYHPNNENDRTRVTMISNGDGIYNNTANANGHLKKILMTNAYAKYKPAEGHEISVDADYIDHSKKIYQRVNSENYNEEQQPAGNNLTLRNTSPSSVHVGVTKVDYAGTLPRKIQMEAGIKSSVSNTDNGSYFDKLENDNWSYDSTRSNNFIYKENINAAYVNATKQWREDWKTQVGLRVENLNAEGKEMTQDKSFTRQNTALFPTVFVSYQADEKNGFELNAGRRVDRPAYTQLSPFTYYFSQYSYYVGNPDLKASYSTFAELKHNYNNKLFTTLSCNIAKNVVTPVYGYLAANNSNFVSFGNNANSFGANFSINYNSQLFEWWLLATSYELNYNAYFNKETKAKMASAFGHSMSWTNQFTLGKGWAADSSFYFATGDLQNPVDLYGPRYWVGFNVSKKILKDTATIRLSANDPLAMHKVNSSGTYNGIQSRDYTQFASQSISLGFTYSFGKKIEGAQQHNNAPEEAGRM